MQSTRRRQHRTHVQKTLKTTKLNPAELPIDVSCNQGTVGESRAMVVYARTIDTSQRYVFAPTFNLLSFYL